MILEGVYSGSCFYPSSSITMRPRGSTEKRFPGTEPGKGTLRTRVNCSNFACDRAVRAAGSRVSTQDQCGTFSLRLLIIR